MSLSGAPLLRVAAAVVFREGEVLMTRRPPGGAHPLLWEFPGGKIESGESAERALVREIEEELGVRASPAETLAVHRHDYPGGPRVEIVFVRCTLDSLEFRPSGAVHAVRWSRPERVDLDGVLAGDHEFLKALAAAGS
jgi:8-oxo-dGTP diphosphatase